MLLDGMQTIAPPGQDFVRVGLVAHVPYQPVARCVVDVMQRDRELHGTEPGGEMSAAGTDALNQEVSQLACQPRELPGRELAQV